MGEHWGNGSLKAGVMSGVKELVEGAVFDQLCTSKSTAGGDSYSRSTLYNAIKTRLLNHMKVPLQKEVESIHSIGHTAPSEAVLGSLTKLISSPEMDLVMCDVEQDIDDVLSAIPISSGSSVLSSLNTVRINGDGKLKPSESLGSDISAENSTFYFGDRALGIGSVDQEMMISRLKRTSLAEVFETSCWVSVRSELKLYLLSNNESLFHSVLQLHARYLLSTSNVAVYESFINLNSSIVENFLSFKRSNESVDFSIGIDLTYFPFVKQLKSMSIIADFFRDMSKKYVRLPLKLLEEVIGNLVDMFSVFLGEEFSKIDDITTLQLFAMIDPSAIWAKRSLHHSSVRVITFRKLSQSPKFIFFILNTISSWFQSSADWEVIEFPSAILNSVSGCHLRFATFFHCLHIFCYCFKYKEGRNIYLQFDGEVTVIEVLKSFVTFLNNAPMCKTTSILHELFLTHIAFPISIISNTLYHNLFWQPLLELNALPQNCDSSRFPIIKLHTVNQIKLMLQSKMGLESLLLNRVNVNSGMAEVSLARMLLSHTYLCLKNYRDVPLDIMRKLLDCCVLIGRSPRGLVEVEESNILSALVTLFCLLKDEIENQAYDLELGVNDGFVHMLDVVAVSISSLAAESGRVWLLERKGILLPILQDLCSKPVLPWGCHWFQRLIASSTLCNGGCEALLAEKVQRMSLSLLWKSWLENNDECFPGNISDELMSSLNDFLSLCSVVKGVNALLTPQEGSEGTLVEGKNPPESLQELLEYTIGVVEAPCNPNVNLQVSIVSTDAISFQELHFGLRLLRFILSSLDSTLLLQHRFLIQEHLMKILVDNLTEESDEVVLNEITLSCDQILRHCFFMESCYERGIFQSRTPRSAAIAKPECMPEQWTSSWNCHYRSHSRRAPCRQKNGLVKFLGNTRYGLRDAYWLSQLRKTFYLALCGNTSPEVKCNLLMEILEEVQKVPGSSSNLSLSKLNWSGDIIPAVLFPEDLIGIKLAIRHGVKLNILLSTPTVHSNFAHFIKTTHGLLKIARYEFLGFDWFLASVFLVCCGNLDRCQVFISNLLRLQVAPFLWVTLGENSVSEPIGKNHVNDHLILLIEQIELVLSVEVPKVLAAFQLSSGSLAVLVHQWVSQCFWNVLEWTEVKNFLCMSIIHGPDYIVYFFVAILFHLEPLILHIMSTSSQHFWEQIKINPTTQFHLGKYLPFIEKLSKAHHATVVKNIMKCHAY